MKLYKILQIKLMKSNKRKKIYKMEKNLNRIIIYNQISEVKKYNNLMQVKAIKKKIKFYNQQRQDLALIV